MPSAERGGRVRTIRKVFQTATGELQRALGQSRLPFRKVALPARVSRLGVLEAPGGLSSGAMAFFSESNLCCVLFYPLHC